MDSILLNNNLKDQDLILDCKKSGLIKIRKISNTNEVVLDVYDNFMKVGNNYFNSIDLLSYFFNIPICLEKYLTYSGNYVPINLRQKRNLIKSIDSFNSDLFDKYFLELNKMCSSKDKKLYKNGRKIDDILRIYHNAQKLFPEFYEESYLNFIRILDVIVKGNGAVDFSDKIIKKIDKKFIKKNLSQIDRKYYKEHIRYSKILFNCKGKSPKNKLFYNEEDKKIFYSMLWSAYEYRNKEIHNGFKLPNKIKEYYEGFSILGISRGESHIMDYENGIFQDIHNELPNRTKRGYRNYKKYYLLLPSWYFLNKVVRQFINKELSKIR